MINTKAELLKFIADSQGINMDIEESNSLEEDFGMDDLDRVELTMALENEFNIEIMNEEAEKFIEVKDIIDFLISKNIELN